LILPFNWGSRANMNEKLKKITLLAAALLMGAGYVAFFYAVRSMNDKELLMKGDIERASAAEGRAISLNNFLRSTAETRASLDGHFVTEGTVADFIERLEGLGAIAGVEASLTSVEVPDNAPILRASFKASGTFSGVYHFIALLEALPYELEIERLSLAKAPAALGKRADLWEGEGSIELTSFLRDAKK
jgi:hypothetical protein